jgi:hypothetical protein
MTPLVSDADLLAAVRALRVQVRDHFGPAWKVSARLMMVARGGHVPPTAWRLEVRDTCDEAGALGYHTDDVVPWGMIGVSTSERDGVPWSSVLSHELLEMLVDPWATLSAQAGNDVVALEVSDPVEGSPYSVDGVMLENFVLPSWFEPGSQPPYDFLGVLKAPLSLAPGGYMQAAKIADWQQTNAAKVREAKQSAGATSRRARRLARMAG